MSQDLHRCPDEPTTINRLLSTLSGVGTGEGAGLLTPLPVLFSGTTLLSPLASSDDVSRSIPKCPACGCGTLRFERSYMARFWRCPQCRTLVLDRESPMYGFSDYGWSVALISDLASHSLYHPPAGKALICVPQ